MTSRHDPPHQDEGVEDIDDFHGLAELTDAELTTSHERLRHVIAEYRETTDSLADRPTVGLRERVLDIVHRETAMGPSTELRTPRGRHFEVLTAAVRAIVRDVVDETPGLAARRVHVDAHDDGAAMSLRIGLSMAPHVGIDDVEPQLRTEVDDAVRREVGVSTARIDLVLEEVHDG
ncbi:Asp23/Gls24 family envelope stress response protein [Nesterenkonia halophila]|uniref:hypothetical protein n=1 Tax=Nesterenkonia halophila TaxID=302044 RepID=UPI0012916480|nr:hypothetical protein [Nesterenkonia halophila]